MLAASLAGLRRSEDLGLRWSDIDLDQGIVTISRGRVLVDTRNVAEGQPKSRNSTRCLSIPDSTWPRPRAMRAIPAQPLAERQVDDGYLAISDLGEPMRPRLYSQNWKRLCRKAKVRELTLHEARHSSMSLMRSKRHLRPSHRRLPWPRRTDHAPPYSHLMPGDIERVADVL